MSTPTDLCNIALRRIGAAPISGNYLTASGKEAAVARTFYDEARRDCLNLHHWNFAIKRASLTASATSPTFGWDYAYPLPADFIRLVSLHPYDDDMATVDYRLEFQSGDDRVIVTNTNTAYIRYVFDLQDVNVYSAAFRDVLSFRLARDFAGGLNKPIAEKQLTDAAFRKKLSRAKAIDGLSDYPESLAEGDWVTDRWPEDSWG